MPERPNRFDSLQNLRYANSDGAFATAFATLMGGAFLVGFIRSLGGGDYWINVVTAIPTALGVLQIPGGIWAGGFPSYKGFIRVGGGIWRAMYIPLMFLPLLPLPNELRLFTLAICVTVAAVAVYAVNSSYNDWLAQLVPTESRGWFFARRNALVTGVGAIAGIVGGFILDSFRRNQLEHVGYSVVFGLGVVFAGISFYWFTRMSDLRREEVLKQDLRVAIRAVGKPFSDREFRRVLIFFGFFILGQSFAGNLYSAFALETLKLPFAVIQGAVMMQAIGTVLASGLWGFLSDKYGNKPCLIIAGLGIATNPIAWMLCRPGAVFFDSVLLLAAHILMGIFWSGVSVTQFNLLLATAKPEDRANYIGAGLSVQGLVGGLAPLLGATMMTAGRAQFPVETAYKIVFFSALVLRGVSILFLVPVREAGSSRVGTTLHDLRRVTARGVIAMRSLSRSTDVSARARAIEDVASEGYTLGSDEVVKALSDPAPKVRRYAALALAKLGDHSAVHALIGHIQEHPDLVEEETVDAIGSLGATEAVPVLVGLLQSPRSILRRAAAKALGRLGSPDAIEALMAAGQEVGDPDLRRASIQALRVLGATDAGPVIYDALFDPHPSVRIAAAEAVAELGLYNALPYVRQSLAYYQDEATSEVAYALGCVGTNEDLPLVLDEAKRAPSPTARRRCLLGVAKLLGAEQQAYRLLLLSGMPRDRALLETMQPLMKRTRKARAALERYTAGDEAGALDALARSVADPELQVLAAYAVDELFLVAVTVASERAAIQAS